MKSKEPEEFVGWQRVIASSDYWALKSSQVEYKFENGNGYNASVGLYIVPESELWSREQLAKMENEVIYIQI